VAVPKRRMSRSNTRSRRSQWKTTVPTLVACNNRACGALKPPHQACPRGTDLDEGRVPVTGNLGSREGPECLRPDVPEHRNHPVEKRREILVRQHRQRNTRHLQQIASAGIEPGQRRERRSNGRHVAGLAATIGPVATLALEHVVDPGLIRQRRRAHEDRKPKNPERAAQACRERALHPIRSPGQERAPWSSDRECSRHCCPCTSRNRWSGRVRKAACPPRSGCTDSVHSCSCRSNRYRR